MLHYIHRNTIATRCNYEHLHPESAAEVAPSRSSFHSTGTPTSHASSARESKETTPPELIAELETCVVVGRRGREIEVEAEEEVGVTRAEAACEEEEWWWWA